MCEERIIKKVASAIWKQRVETAAKNGVDLSKDDEEFMISANSIVDEARAAIEAYEAAKIKSLEGQERRLIGNAGAPVSGLEQAYINAILRNGFN